MHFDRLDEIYTLIKSNWQFGKVTLTGLTGLHNRSDRFAQFVQQILTCANFDRQQQYNNIVKYSLKNVEMRIDKSLYVAC